MKNSPNETKIPVQERAGKAVSIAVRVLGATAVANLAPGVATLKVETASAAEKKPKAEVAHMKYNRAKEMKQVERKLERRINDNLDVPYLDATLQVTRKKSQPSTGGAEAFIPPQGPESQGMADDNESVSPMDQYSVYFIDKPMVGKSKSGHKYAAYFNDASPKLDLTIVPMDARTHVIEDDFHSGEMRSATVMPSNSLGVWDTSRAVDMINQNIIAIGQRAEIDYN
jgi:hypothetical protein